jgi:hypothetical protein
MNRPDAGLQIEFLGPHMRAGAVSNGVYSHKRPLRLCRAGTRPMSRDEIPESGQQ